MPLRRWARYRNVDPGGVNRQPGTTTQINNGDSRFLYAVWKNGRLSTEHTVACGGTNACGGFTELNVAAYPTITTLNDWVLTAGGVGGHTVQHRLHELSRRRHEHPAVRTEHLRSHRQHRP
jgi:hypothetical protein